MKKFFIKAAIFVFILGAIIFSFMYWGVYSRGVRSGIIMRIAERGTIFKTFEGEMNTQALGASADFKQVSERWLFSVERGNPDVIAKLEKASLSGDRVALTYVRRYSTFLWRGETEIFVTEVTFGEPKPSN